MVVEQRRGREGMRVSTQTDEELACNSFFIRVMEGDFFSLEIVFRVFFIFRLLLETFVVVKMDLRALCHFEVGLASASEVK